MAATAQAFVLTARAKFNVRLEIGAVRADGLHDVRSVVGDEVAFQPSETGFSVTCDDPGIPQADNLAWRAAQALGFTLPSVHIHVRKVLPQQAGLGGGSADAAAALRGLASIMADMGITLPGAALRQAASRVGSDVAACLTPGFKFVEGSGQTVRPLAALALPWGVLLLKPAAGMPTAHAYRLLDEARRSGAVTSPHHGSAAADLCDALARGDFPRTCALAHNDFQAVIEAALPEVADARTRLRAAGAAVTILCGSGSCVAGLFEDVVAAGRALTLLRPNRGEWTAATGFAQAPVGSARDG